MEITRLYLQQVESNKQVFIYNVSDRTLRILGYNINPYDSILVSKSKANTIKSMLGDKVHVITN